MPLYSQLRVLWLSSVVHFGRLFTALSPASGVSVLRNQAKNDVPCVNSLHVYFAELSYSLPEMALTRLLGLSSTSPFGGPPLLTERTYSTWPPAIHHP